MTDDAELENMVLFPVSLNNQDIDEETIEKLKDSFFETWPEAQEMVNPPPLFMGELYDRHRRYINEHLSDDLDLPEGGIEDVHVWQKQAMDLTQTFLMALLDEATETLNELPWKHWSDDYGEMSEVDLGALREELVDMQHFMNNLLMVWFDDFDEFLMAFKQKLRKNERRQEEGYQAHSDGSDSEDISGPFDTLSDDGSPDTDKDPFRDLPEEAPKFARGFDDQTPIDGDEIVIWDDEFGLDHEIWVWDADAAEAADPETDDAYATLSTLKEKARWLPASHCRIDGKLPEKAPLQGEKVYGYDYIREGPWKGDWNIPNKLSKFSCWDYVKGLESSSDRVVRQLRDVIDMPWVETSEPDEYTTYVCGILGRLEYRVVRTDSGHKAQAIVGHVVVAEKRTDVSASAALSRLILKHGESIKAAAGTTNPLKASTAVEKEAK